MLRIVLFHLDKATIPSPPTTTTTTFYDVMLYIDWLTVAGIGSWDDSDQDERTLRELRANYRQEKQKEVLKTKENEGINYFPC